MSRYIIVLNEYQTNFIKENYKSKGIQFCIDNLKLSRTKICTEAKKLGLVDNRPQNAWSLEQVKWLSKNFSKLGPKKCAEKLNKSYDMIIYKAQLLKLKKNNLVKVDINDFINIKKPEIAYFLGYVWSDGTLTKSISGNYLAISISIQYKDYNNIKHIFKKVGNLKVVPFYHAVNNKKFARITIQDGILAKLLYRYDFHIKSYVAPTKILNNISPEIHNYFWLGLFDGDGHISKNKYFLKITSRIDYDWEEHFKLCKLLNIQKCYITKSERKQPTGKISHGSEFTITNLPEILKFCQYIYVNYNYDNIGLKRKYIRYDKLTKVVLPKFSSKYIGVSWNKNERKWLATIILSNSKVKRVGGFNTEIEAIKARNSYISKNNISNKPIQEIIL